MRRHTRCALVTGVHTCALPICWIGAINRVSTEAPWNIGEFYGQSYFVNPRGQIEKIASRDQDELIVHDLDMELIRTVRNTWQFFRDRRPETYGRLTDEIGRESCRERVCQ